MRIALLVALVTLVLAPAADAGVQHSAKPAVVTSAALSKARGVPVKCWASPWWVQWTRRSLAQVVVWRYRLTISDYCWTGRRIVLIRSRRSAKVNVPLWDFAGHIDQETDWNGKWSFRRYTEGRFVWTRPVGVAVRTPEVWFKVRGDGWFDYGAVGD